MTVKAIVCRKGTDVVTIDPTASLASAAKTLATHRIGAVIITGADRQVVGILSERDIVRALAERGSSALEVLTARSALLQALSQLADALAAANTARADLDRALGLSVTTNGARTP